MTEYKYKVKYLKHSLFKPCEQVETTVTRVGLVALLEAGMISVLSAEIII